MFRKFILGILLLSGLYALLPFVYLARYDHPSADDYVYVVQLQARGLWQMMTHYYFHWTGRYSLAFIYWFSPVNFHSLAQYRIFPVIMIILFTVASIILLRSLVSPYLSFAQVIGLTCLLVFLYLSQAPSISEAFYWYSGASVYQLANILGMLLVATLVRRRGALKKDVWKVLGCALLCIFIIGCNEVPLIITVLFLLYHTKSRYSADKKLDPGLVFLCVVCVLSALVEVLAPGNSARLDSEHSRSLAWTIAGTLSITAVYIAQWAGPLLAVSVLYVPFFGIPLAHKMRAAPTTARQVKDLLWFFLGTFCILQVFIIWVAGGSSLGRIFDVIYLFFILCYFSLLQLLLNKNLQRVAGLTKYAAALSVLGVALFLANMFDINNNISTAYLDIVSGKARQYDRELTARLRTAKECKSDTCYVPALSAIPSTIFFTDIRPRTDSTGLWINYYYSQYYHVKFVVPDHPPPVATPNIETLRTIGRSVRGTIMKE
jgi:hypothetical protein